MAKITKAYVTNILESGVFKNVKDFMDFHKRIKRINPLNGQTLKTTQGDIFELFIEALLSVDNTFAEVKNVWKVGFVPLKVRQKLSLPLQDRGYDGVYETKTGVLVSYQVKWRSNIERKLCLNEPDHIGGFMGISRKVSKLHLFASCSQVVEDYTNQEGNLCTFIHDLKKISKHTFKNIEHFLDGKKSIKNNKHILDPYQKKVVDDVINEFKNKDRATTIMACGTGKSDIGVEIYKKIKPKISLVFVPSLALIQQLRSDWIRQIGDELNYTTYRFCSIKEKLDDNDSYTSKGMYVDANTNKSEFSTWLESNVKHKIIFCTYQSSSILGSFFPKDRSIDLAIFDEAHRTAVVNKKSKANFSYGLFDKNIKIKKRLFMTATRRLSHRYKIRNEGDPINTLTMDNTEIYGCVVANLSFMQAADIGCIARPKILVQEVLSDSLEYEKLKKSVTYIKGEKNPSERIAVQVAISIAVKKFNIKKFFSFHKTVRRAEIYSDLNDNSSSMVNFIPKEFYINTIKGADSLSKRETIMDEFSNSNYGYISNCRCLIEGVDVPEVEMVVFADPKKSLIDVVQAAGRALRNRKNKKKKFGYFLIPIFRENHIEQSDADALENSPYERLSEFLIALAEHDNEISDLIYRSITESRGPGGRFELTDIIESTTDVDLLEIIKNTKITLSKKLRTKWHKMIDLAYYYQDDGGDINSIFSDDNNYIELWKWLTNIRRRWRKGDLSSFHIDKLLECGIEPSITGELVDTSGLVRKNHFENITGLSNRVIDKIINTGLVKPEGFVISANHGSKEYLYKKYSIDELKKILGVDYFSVPKGYLSISKLSKKLKVSKEFCKNVLDIKKHLSIKAISKGSGSWLSGFQPSTHYKDISLKNFESLCDGKVFFNVNKYVTANFLAKKFNISANLVSSYLNEVFVSGKRAGKYDTQKKYYINYSYKQIIKEFSVDTLKAPKDYYTLSEICKRLNISRNSTRVLEKRLKKLHKEPITKIGRGGKHGGKVKLYKVSKNEFDQKLR